MSQKANPTLIGGFVVGAAALVVAGLMIFGGGRFFSDRVTYVAYFQGSVSGLAVGAPVEFRGVQIGEVSRIQAVFDRDALELRIPVYIEFEPDRVTFTAGEPGRPGESLPALIERGLRAQLQVQSLVTGQLMVSLDLHPDAPLVFVDPDSTVPELPTVRSSLEELQARIERLPLDEIAAKLLSAVQGIDRLLNSPELGNLIASFDRTVDDFGVLARNVDRRVGPVSTSLEEALSIAGENSPVRYELVNTLAEVSAAARSIRTLADYLQRHPESLISGKGASGGS